MLDRMSRWVNRHGTEVTFGNVVGPFIGRPYTYRLPDDALAAEFEAVVATLDEHGNPAAVDPVRWEQYRVKS